MQEDRAVQSAKDSKRPPPSRTSLAPRGAENSQDTSERLKALEKTTQDMSVTVLYARPPQPPFLCFTPFTLLLSLFCSYLEKERDFYFSKLRQIEILCQTQPQGSVDSQKVLGILWSEE